MSSAGRPDKVKNAKEQISAGILGLIILFSSYISLAAINPQLAILKPPAEISVPESSSVVNFEYTPAKMVFEYQEIPAGTLINSERNYGETGAYSQYEGALHSERLKRIFMISSLAKVVSEQIKNLSEELRDLINGCECQRTYEGECTPATCDLNFTQCKDTCNKPCTWGPENNQDPCYNRADIEDKRKELGLLSGAFDYYLKEKLKVKDFALANKSAIKAYSDPIDSADVYDLIIYMEEYEEKYGEIEINLKEYKDIKDKLYKAEAAIVKCPIQARSYSDFQVFKSAVEQNEESEISISKLFSKVEAGEDPATFYCLMNLK